MPHQKKDGRQICREVRHCNPEAPKRDVKYAQTPDLDSPIAWNFQLMDKAGKFRCSLKLLDPFYEELIRLEGKTIGQLLEKAHNHPMGVSKLSAEARARLEVLDLEPETLYQLDLRTPARLWGILEAHIFHIIWLDPNHEVYISG